MYFKKCRFIYNLDIRKGFLCKTLNSEAEKKILGTDHADPLKYLEEKRTKKSQGSIKE